MPIIPRTGGYNIPITPLPGNIANSEKVDLGDGRVRIGGTSTPGSDKSKPYRTGKKNKIIWGGAVTPGSSGGDTSYNPETGQVEYISGYESEGGDEGPSAPIVGLQNAAPGKKPSSGGGKKSAPKPKPKSPKPPSGPPPQVPIDEALPPMQAPDPHDEVLPPMPAPEGGPASKGLGALRGLMPTSPIQQSTGGDPMGAPGLQWLDGPEALRRGLGNRVMPQQNAPLAGLGRVIY